MTNNSSSTMEVPQAKDAMDKFKMEVASEIGVNLKQGYNGDLTSAQAGSIGGEMVRRMIKRRGRQSIMKRKKRTLLDPLSRRLFQSSAAVCRCRLGRLIGYAADGS